MSHVRNLFYKPLGLEYSPTVASVHAPPQDIANAARAVLEFPVEEAHLDPETRIVYYTQPHSAEADRFRFLRMHLREFRNAGKIKKLLVTSPLPNEGKSTVVLNLATALSERGKRTVLVVGADLHRSSLPEILGLESTAGLTECLQEGLDPMSAIRRVEPLGWYLLASGVPCGNPTELLHTPALSHVMERLADSFDWILIDSPPVIPLTDAISLQEHVDGSLLVVRADRTPREAVEQAMTLLGKKKLIGVVLNAVQNGQRLYYKYRYDDGRGRK